MMTQRSEPNYYKLGLTIFFSGAALIFFFLARDVISVFLLAAILSIATHPIVTWSEKRKIPGYFSLLIAYLVLGSVFTILFIDLLPTVVNRLSTLIQELPNVVQGFIDSLSAFAEARKINFIPKEQINEFIVGVSKFLATKIVDLTANTFTLLGTILFVFFISGFLALDSKNIRNGFIQFFPSSYEDLINEKVDLFNDAIKRAFYGKIIVSAILGITIFIGLWILQVERFVALSVLAFILDFIPFIGSIVATILGVMFGLTYSVFTGLAVLILYLVANFIEMNITTPIFIGKEASLHPVLVLLAIGLVGSVWGLLGVVISIPLAAAVIAVTKTDS